MREDSRTQIGDWESPSLYVLPVGHLGDSYIPTTNPAMFLRTRTAGVDNQRHAMRGSRQLYQF